jgi:hypothetical protein
MMTPDEELQVLVEEVARLACSCEPPTLDTADLESCVRRAARLAVDPTEAYQFYDLTRAVFNAWELKKARAVTLVAQSSAGQSYQMQLVFEHCAAKARDWQPFHAA